MSREPLFYLQIAHPDGTVVRTHGGGALERDFVAACTENIAVRGVGFFKTEAQVRTAIRDGIADTIRQLKWETVAVVESH